MAYTPPPFRLNELTYTGDGAASKKITIGFRAKFIATGDQAGGVNTGGILFFDTTGRFMKRTNENGWQDGAAANFFTDATTVDVGHIAGFIVGANTLGTTYLMDAYG